jgi:hypothetical protein
MTLQFLVIGLLTLRSLENVFLNVENLVLVWTQTSVHSFMVFSRTVLGFIVSKKNKVMGPKKVGASVNMLIPTLLGNYTCSMGWHNSTCVPSKTLLQLSHLFMNITNTWICDLHEHCQTYDLCQWTSNMLAQNMAQLITTLFKEPFQKCGLDFIGPIKLTSYYYGNWFILVSINYATKWMEVRALCTNITNVTTKFLYDHISI